MSWQRPNIGSRVNRQVHARFWERPEVKVLRATRHFRRSRPEPSWSAVIQQAEVRSAVRYFRHRAKSGSVCTKSNKEAHIAVRNVRPMRIEPRNESFLVKLETTLQAP